VIASGAPERDHLVISIETFEKRRGAALAHELTHQFVFELLPQGNRDTPWVSEALPDHYSGSWTPSQRAKLRDAVDRGLVPGVEDLAAWDRDWGDAIFDFIAREYGAQGIRQFLAALRDGSTAAEAIHAALRLSADDFNAAFLRYATAYVGDR